MKPQSINIDFFQRQVMAILNITPDSFFENSRTSERGAIEKRVSSIASSGATIIDIGGYSSRPGADDPSPAEEWERVARGLEVVRRIAPEMTISLDTFRSEVARRAVEGFGAMIINDISAGERDPEILSLAGEHKLPYIAMHMRGKPQSMQSLAAYDDIVSQVRDYLQQRIEIAHAAGIEQVVVDPGFGFAKSLEQNYTLMAGLAEIAALGVPLLVGVSRKSMIYKLLETTPDEALAGTIALGWESLRAGASILRVHDPREAVETIKIFNALQKR